MVAENGMAVKSPQTLKAAKCTELSYRIVVPKDRFDVERFASALGPSVKSNKWNSVVLIPRNEKLTDYHLHVFWKPDPDPEKMRLQVDYHPWQSESKGKEAAPFAEDFFDWAKQFFSSESERAHIHAEFEYPVKQWHSNIMALPIKVPFGNKTADIEGLSINLPSEPHGVRQVWLLRGKKHFTLQMFADRAVAFKNFTPHGDVDAFVSVIKNLIEENKA